MSVYFFFFTFKLNLLHKSFVTFNYNRYLEKIVFEYSYLGMLKIPKILSLKINPVISLSMYLLFKLI